MVLKPPDRPSSKIIGIDDPDYKAFPAMLSAQLVKFDKDLSLGIRDLPIDKVRSRQELLKELLGVISEAQVQLGKTKTALNKRSVALRQKSATQTRGSERGPSKQVPGLSDGTIMNLPNGQTLVYRQGIWYPVGVVGTSLPDASSETTAPSKENFPSTEDSHPQS